MFVNHLGHRIAQQHNILIKGFNIALQLNAVDQIDRNRNMLFAQCIEMDLVVIEFCYSYCSLFIFSDAFFILGVLLLMKNNLLQTRCFYSY